MNQVIKISDLPEEERQKIVEAAKSAQCPRCGCTGLHACIGHHVTWTNEDKTRLKEALSKMYGWKKKDRLKGKK